MTLESRSTRMRYIGNGSAVQFPGPGPVLRPEHVRVFTTNANGAAVEITSGFEVYIEADQTCTVMFSEPPAPGQVLVIARIVPLIQQMDLQQGGAFDAEVLEQSLDVIVMQVQQLAEELERCLKAAITIDGPAPNVEEIYAGVAAIVQRAEDALLAIQKITDSIVLAKGVTNLRGTWATAAPVPAGELLRLPVGYFPGRNMLLLVVDGLTCHPAGADVPAELPQYEEVGREDEVSRDVRLLFDAPAGTVWSAWAIASNVSQHQAENLAATETALRAAQEAASQAEAAKVYVDDRIANAADIAAGQAAETAVAAAQEALRALAESAAAARDAALAASTAAASAASSANEAAEQAANEAAESVRAGLTALMTRAESAADDAAQTLAALHAVLPDFVKVQAEAAGAVALVNDAAARATSLVAGVEAAKDAAEAAAAQAAVAASAAANEASAAAVQAAEQHLAALVVTAEAAAEKATATTAGRELVSLSGCRAGEVAAGQPWQVPAYIVGAGALRVFVDGFLCVAGPNGAQHQYLEVGQPGQTSTAITWHDAIPAKHDIVVII